MRRIEYQSARVAENPNFDFNSTSTQDLMREKSIELLTAVIEFLDSALLYYNQAHFGTFTEYISDISQYSQDR